MCACVMEKKDDPFVLDIIMLYIGRTRSSQCPTSLSDSKDERYDSFLNIHDGQS